MIVEYAENGGRIFGDVTTEISTTQESCKFLGKSSNCFVSLVLISNIEIYFAFPFLFA